jgi:hypothetical protein
MIRGFGILSAAGNDEPNMIDQQRLTAIVYRCLPPKSMSTGLNMKKEGIARLQIEAERRLASEIS